MTPTTTLATTITTTTPLTGRVGRPLDDDLVVAGGRELAEGSDVDRLGGPLPFHSRPIRRDDVRQRRRLTVDPARDRNRKTVGLSRGQVYGAKTHLQLWDGEEEEEEEETTSRKRRSQSRRKGK